jgi:hypothetical protein
MTQQFLIGEEQVEEKKETMPPKEPGPNAI